jgi:hypothetical protein
MGKAVPRTEMSKADYSSDQRIESVGSFELRFRTRAENVITAIKTVDITFRLGTSFKGRP